MRLGPKADLNRVCSKASRCSTDPTNIAGRLLNLARTARGSLFVLQHPSLRSSATTLIRYPAVICNLQTGIPCETGELEIREFRRSRPLLELISAPSAVQGVSDQSLTSIRSNAFSGMGGRAGGFGGLGRLVVETWLATGREDAT